MKLDSDAKMPEFTFFVPAKIVKAEHGIGSFLNFFLNGKLPVSEAVDRSICKIQVWVYLCDWTLREGDKVVLTSETVGSPDQLFDLSSFNGATLTDIRLDEKAGHVIFEFDRHLRLILFPDVAFYGADEDLFRVYMDDTILFSFSWSHKFQWKTTSKEH